MCDNDSFDDMIAQRSAPVSRRAFGSLSLGAGLSTLTTGCGPSSPILATASPNHEGFGASRPLPTVETEVSITTPDGACDAYFVRPNTGKAPAVILWPDIFGLRPAFRQMGKRLAESGYAVVVVNPFYRIKKAPTAALGANLEDQGTRDELMGLMHSLTSETAVTDAKALVTWLDQQPGVDTSRKMGTTGYCMGGPIVMRTAAARSDRIGAAATFHGGGLVTDKPDSPHLLIPKMKAQFLIAIAANDDLKQPEAKDTLKASFLGASLPASVEVFDGTMHGWCPPDSRVYDARAAERAWSELLALLKRALA